MTENAAQLWTPILIYIRFLRHFGSIFLLNSKGRLENSRDVFKPTFFEFELFEFFENGFESSSSFSRIKEKISSEFEFSGQSSSSVSSFPIYAQIAEK